MADQRESKTSLLMGFLQLFTGGAELDMRKLAKSFGLRESSIRNLASMNPTELGTRDGHWLVVKERGASSRTGHNVREEGQPANGFVVERPAKPDRPKRSGRRTLRSQRGDENAY